MDEFPRTVQVELVPLDRTTVRETTPSLGRLMIPINMGPRDMDGLLGRSGLVYRIQGRRLRGSIGECMQALDLSLENLTMIEWEEPSPLPETAQELVETDWIRTVDISPVGGILTGSYDGSVRWYALHQQGEPPSPLIRGTFKYGLATKSTVTVVRWLSVEEQSASSSGPFLFLAGMSDGSIYLWSTFLSSSVCSEEIPPKAILTGHTSAIQAVHVIVSGEDSSACYLVYTADYEGLVCKYKLDLRNPPSSVATSTTPMADAGGPPPKGSAKRKRRGGSKTTVPTAQLLNLRPAASLRLNTTVAAILSASASLLLVAAWDGNMYRVHSDKLVLDSEGRRSPLLLNTDPISCATMSNDVSLLVTGHSNGSIRFWDPVSGERRALQREAHLGWVAGVRLLTDASSERNLLASAGYDGRMRWWELSDISQACNSIEQGGKKILALASHGHICCTGGEDRTLRIYR